MVAERSRHVLYEPIREDGGGAVTGIFVGGYDATDRVRAAGSSNGSPRRAT